MCEGQQDQTKQVGYPWQKMRLCRWGGNDYADEAAVLLRDELGALTGRAVRRRRVCRLAVRELLHRRAAEWLLHKYAAAKARVDFAPGGAGAQLAAAEFTAAAGGQALTDEAEVAAAAASTAPAHPPAPPL